MRQTVLVLALAACVFGQFPYQVSLQWVMFGIASHTCGGSIVSASVVVTAGHCLDPKAFGYYEVVAGINSLTNDSAFEQRMQVAQQIRHPSYQEDFNVAINDVAIFQLKTSLSLGGNLDRRRRCLAGAAPAPESAFFHILQWVDVTFISNTECAQLMPDSPVNDNNVCAGSVDGSISACTGASGYPLVQDGTLIGIVSWGIWNCATVGTPSVFTWVAAFTDFINQYI
ncbi:trypsin-1-like [Schistocerca serialis cubense]|uniref:trypsin-1-like n=1 Tax=Schistocerca serialis cubense TaxID=2023355 RepID=UPI00214EFCDD|nr:trypsin-1-like [Schistocerca serialis cubense]